MKNKLYFIISLFIISFLYADQKRDMMLPDMLIKLIDGEQTRLSSLLEDGPILVEFWATWCAPCKEEMPSLNRLQSNKSFYNLKIFPINMGRESILRSQEFFDQLRIDNLEVYIEDTVKTANQFSLRGLPTTILIYKKGEEFARILGAIDFDNKKFIEWLKNYD